MQCWAASVSAKLQLQLSHLPDGPPTAMSPMPVFMGIPAAELQQMLATPATGDRTMLSCVGSHSSMSLCAAPAPHSTKHSDL